MAFWGVVWRYLVGALVLGGVSGGRWWLWRTDRFIRGGDRQGRHDEAVRAGHRTLAEVDAMTGTEFEDFVVELYQRDGCTDVRRVGGSHDNGGRRAGTPSRRAKHGDPVQAVHAQEQGPQPGDP
ncbi:restriction endonuclease [Streptomyces sp. DSM 41014]|uniref:Restriction endonuclease n=1 Tax=Streptomyces hintoniae TaxID=3075521 RepID=A0ABU2UM09_9ACTN|nr:restriction endonuclease [Streptomyces sp. DSM 41014]MDT0474311.1 restriction endonuclease [Streptomyces sp. DSM 41014]